MLIFRFQARANPQFFGVINQMVQMADLVVILESDMDNDEVDHLIPGQYGTQFPDADEARAEFAKVIKDST